MTTTQIVTFVLVVLGNGIIAWWKKYKDRQEQQAAARLERSSGGAQAIDDRLATRKAQRAERRQPPVAVDRQPASDVERQDTEAFEDAVRIQLRRLAAMQAVLDAAGSDARAAATSEKQGMDAAEAVAAKASADRPATVARGTRLLGAVSLRNAILAREVLGPPRSARPWTGTIS